ncbi:hypothetical protein ASC94_07860 [Massilia sp. Root418]|uniref:hypothetical protein n=1 Tax=Massilia sp. Root418 TaxID=1736532 RepID=UPI0006F64EB2|nr:hypothetical protein [Massilia sp. Root418]KQW96733.1 hypothetical protein ASC94_07860 [Massilia sp. Root418]
MPKVILSMLSAALLSTPVFAAAAQLTDVEARWLQAGAAVLAYAKQQQLPIDIIVQPQAQPGAVPLAMGFDGGRCKLVFTMRGNPAAEDVLQAVPAAQRALMIEAMTAHEVAHCWRYAQGAWHSVPSGFQERTPDAAQPPEIQKLTQELRETRREEGFADLAALAWVQRSHPGEYGQVYGWLRQVRAAQPDSHVSHDTEAWLALAASGAAFSEGTTPFEQARSLWKQGLQAAE